MPGRAKSFNGISTLKLDVHSGWAMLKIWAGIRDVKSWVITIFAALASSKMNGCAEDPCVAGFPRFMPPVLLPFLKQAAAREFQSRGLILMIFELITKP